MLFGQSVFQSVLTRLKAEQENTDEPIDESFRIRGLNTGFVASTTDETEPTGTGTEAYYAFMQDAPEPQAARPAQPKAERPAEASTPFTAERPARAEPVTPPPAPPKAPPAQPMTSRSDRPATAPEALAPRHLLRLTREEIAQELAIQPQDTEQGLAEKRRQFAKANHPDRVAPAYRDNAHIRMQTANLLIDQAIKRLAFR